MMVHQIFISDRVDPTEDSRLDANKEMFRNFYPDYDYRLWRENDIQDFFSQYYPSIINSYNKLQAYSAKADLARLVIVNHFGGWYYDFYTEPILKIDTSELDMVFFRDIQANSSTSFAVCTGLFYSVSNNKVLSTAIDSVLENIELKYYGGNPLCPTSVVPFGRAIAIHGYSTRHLIGDHKDVGNKRVFLLENKKLFANGKSIEGGKIDMLGTNNYNEIWNQKNYYGESGNN